MRYLLKVEWTDPVASAVARVLSTLPAEVEQTTAYVPPGASRGFLVIDAGDPAALERVARAVAAAAAAVRVVVGHESLTV